MAADSTKAVVAAVAGNAILAGLKLTAFALSGSGAMLSEGIHSVADTTNQALLFLGIRLSKRPPDERHPYGYGAERYFWSLVSAMGIFILGSGVTVYHGIIVLLHPEHLHIGWVTWVALAAGFSVDGFVFLLALRLANQRRGKQGWIQFLRSSRDPALLAVLFEDGIACMGIFIAAGGIGLSLYTGLAMFDGIASILIGLLLGAMALGLAIRNRALLLGEAASPDLEQRVRRVVLSSPVIGKLLRVRTRILDADAHLVDLQVDFDAGPIVDRLRPEIEEASSRIRNADDLESFARTFAEHVLDELAKEVDQLEDRIRSEVPSAQIIDVEGD